MTTFPQSHLLKHGQCLVIREAAAQDAAEVIDYVHAISEDMVVENGRPKSTRLRQCGVLRAKQTPAMEVIGVEVPDPYGPYGAKGVGEIGLVPTAGAVANALYQFDGIRRRELPMQMPKKKRTVVRKK